MKFLRRPRKIKHGFFFTLRGKWKTFQPALESGKVVIKTELLKNKVKNELGDACNFSLRK